MNKILVTGANSFIIYKHPEINRLMGSLQIDNSYVREILNWTPPVSVEEGIRRMVKGK
jgi:nucleoside-diphosphate-sugar epimerase